MPHLDLAIKKNSSLFDMIKLAKTCLNPALMKGGKYYTNKVGS